MSTAADRAAANAERLRASRSSTPSPAPVPDDDPTVAPPAKARVKPIRITYDMSPARYRAFDEWRRDVAFQLGEARVTAQDTLDAMVARLSTDETFARKIIADLRAPK